MNHVHSSSPESGAAGFLWGRTGFVVGVLAVTALAAFVRVFELDAESFWSDEYGVAGFLRGPSLEASWRLMLFWGPDNAFLFKVLATLLHAVTGPDVFLLRLLPVTFGVLTVTVTALFARSWIGGPGALFAAACVALSPTHIWFSQAFRPYSLFVLFAVVSVFTLPAVVSRQPRSLYGLHHASNFIMFITHPFTVFLLPAEFVWLWFRVRDSGSRLVRWCVLNGLYAIPTAALLFYTHRYVFTPESDHFFLPPFTHVLWDIFADDAFALSTESAPALVRVPMGISPWLWSGVDRIAEIAIGLAGPIALAWLAFAARRGDAGRRDRATLLLLVLILPVALLYFASLVWRPLIMPRYTVFAPIFLYTGLAWLVIQLRGRGRLIAVSVVLATLTFLTVDLLNSNTRMNFVGVTRTIAESEHSDDHIVSRGLPPFGTDMLQYHVVGDQRVQRTLTADTMVHDLAAYLKVPREDPAGVWAVYDLVFLTYPGVEASLKDAFGDRDVSMSFHIFHGMTSLLAVHLNPGPGFDAKTLPTLETPLHELEAVAREDPDAVRVPEIVEAYGVPLPDFQSVWYGLSMILVESGYPHLGVVAARYGVTAHPEFMPGYLAVCTALTAVGDFEGARTAFERSRSRNDILVPAFAPFFEALLVDRNMALARDRLDALTPLGMPTGAFAVAYESVTADVPDRNALATAP